MKRFLAILAVVVITALAFPSFTYGENDLSWMDQITPAPVTDIPPPSIIIDDGYYRSANELQPLSASLTKRTTARSGPGTKYTSEHVINYGTPIVIFEQEIGGTATWGMIEFRADGGKKRVYVGMKIVRVGANIPWANTRSITATVGNDVIPLYGPGDEYKMYPKKQVLRAGTSIEIFHEENGYVMTDFKFSSRDKSWVRAWLPLDCLADYQSRDYMVKVTPTPKPTPKPTPTPIPIVEIINMSMAGNHSGYVDKNHDLWMVGWNDSGQIGVGQHRNTISSPRKVLSNVAQVSCGFYHTLALDLSGQVYAWGRGHFGRLGTGKTSEVTKPARIVISGIKAIATGEEHSVALGEGGIVYTWGYNKKGQLGLSNTKDQTTPQQVKELSDVVAIAAGGNNTAVIKADGSLWMAGDISCGQFDKSGKKSGSVFVRIDLPPVAQVSVGDYHAAALTQAGDMYIWGGNENGQLGDARYKTNSVPTLIMSDVKKISIGDHHSFALKNDGSLWGWGFNKYGQIGNRETMDVITPTLIMNNVADVETGYCHTVALLTDGRFMGWGRNEYGPLGLDGNTQLVHPTQIAPTR